ncbi:hypothetical protein [Clostridium butyricum]|uniref:hypothetical protein n=1 Tax=Clostridium butyricum TaxID=1492 RepID=UPI00325B2D19
MSNAKIDINILDLEIIKEMCEEIKSVLDSGNQNEQILMLWNIYYSLSGLYNKNKLN